MDILLRESLFGRILNSVSNNKAGNRPPDDGTHLSPRNWPAVTKAFATAGVMLLNFSFYAASAIFTPSIPLIEKELGATTAQGTLGLSLFVIAYGIGPLILSPLSNLASIGRSPVYVVGSLLFCIINIGTAVARNVPTILGLRFLGGLVGSAPISVGGATLMEIYGPTEVPYAIAFYAIFGTLCMTRWRTWAATLWLIAGITALTTVFVFFLLPETLMANILYRQSRRNGNDSDKGSSTVFNSVLNFTAIVAKQMVDDFKLSCTDPVVLCVNIHTMLIYGILYLWFEFFPFVFGGIYGFDAVQQALAFFGILIGAVLSVTAYLLWLYFVYQPKAADPNGVVQPEDRLRPGQVGAVCIPICLFIIAWTSRESIHWIVPIIGTGFFAPGFYLTFQSVLNYLGEAYPRHVASVFAANTFFRSSFGGALPLAAPRMLHSLGIGWSSSILGFIAIILVPLPVVLERYGKRLRSWSNYAN